MKASGWKHLIKYLQENNISYREYLQSEHWQELKARFRQSKLCKHRCYVCGGAEHINIHHKSYKRIGRERLNDLIELCQDCHYLTHELDKKRTSQHHNLWNAHKRARALVNGQS